MARFGYSVLGLDPDRTALASLREADFSHKHAREICNEIKGKLVDRAIDYLDEVIKKERSVPFRRHHKKGGHRSDLEGWDIGRYPVKASKQIKQLLRNLQNNAENKGLEVDRLLLIHAAAQKGRKVERIFPRAFGSSSPKHNILTHVEVAAEEI